jgi:hypothetical protein
MIVHGVYKFRNVWTASADEAESRRRNRGGLSAQVRSEAEINKQGSMIRMEDLIEQIDATSGNMVKKGGIKEEVVQAFLASDVGGNFGRYAVCSGMWVDKAERASNGGKEFGVVTQSFIKSPTRRKVSPFARRLVRSAVRSVINCWRGSGC